MFRSVAKFLIFYLKEKFPEFDRHWTFIMMDVRAQIQKYKNTIRDGGSIALYTAGTVYTTYTVNTVYTVHRAA